MTDDNTQIRDAIKNAIDENEVILFMKGTPEQPVCGFSARTVAALQALGTPFAAVDILPDPRIRQELSQRSRTGRRSRSCSSTASSSAAATSSPRCSRTASWPSSLGVEQPADAPVEAAAAPPRQSAPMQIQDRP